MADIMDFTSRKAVAHKVYEKQDDQKAIAGLTWIQNMFGQRAADICHELHERHHREDPFAVPSAPVDAIHEEHWLLDQDSRDLRHEWLAARLASSANGESTEDPYAPKGEDLVQELASIIHNENMRRQAQGQPIALFEDPHFPADASSIFADPDVAAAKERGYVDPNRRDLGDLADKIKDVRALEWLRPSQFGNPNETPVIYSGGIDPDDISQGVVGNCYFLAAIQGCGKAKEDHLIRDLCIEDPIVASCGMFGVKFYLNGKWVTVLVDDRVPCEPIANGTYMPIFSKPKGHKGQMKGEKELWALIFEKAWAKLNLSYEATDGGFTADTTNFLTGGTITEFDVDETKWNTVYNFFADEYKHTFLSCSIKCPEIDPTTLQYTWGLVDGHAYSVLNVVQTRDGQRFVQVRNPWGSWEWKGRFSDKSPDWTPQLKHELGFRDEEDGTFWMLWSDFCYFFGSVEVCDPEAIADVTEGGNNHCRVDVFASHWIRGYTAGGPDTCKTWKHNPVCILTVTNDGPVEVCMYQPDVRPVQLVISPAPQLLQVQLILKDTKTGELTELFEGCKRVHSYRMQARADREYHLIAAAWSPGVESAFWITAAGPGCELRSGLKYLPPTNPTKEEEDLMSLETPRRVVCVVCHEEDHSGYYQTKEGYKCDDCQSRKKPALKGKGYNPYRAAPVKRAVAAPQQQMQRSAAPPVQQPQTRAAAPPPPAPAPVAPKPQEKMCYYCDKVLNNSNSQTTQYGPACKPGCWPQAQTSAVNSSVDFSYSRTNTTSAPSYTGGVSYTGGASYNPATVYPTVGSAGAVYSPRAADSFYSGFPAVTTTAPTTSFVGAAPAYSSVSYANAPMMAPPVTTMGPAMPSYSGVSSFPAYSGGFPGGFMQPSYGGQVYY